MATATDILRWTASPAALAEHASEGWWKPAAHLALIDRALFDAATGACPYLIVEMPPGTGKSELVGHWFPTWYLSTFPDRQVGYVTYAADQAATYGRACRDSLDQLAPMLGVRVCDDSSAAGRWGIHGRRGGMYAVGIHGPLMGKRLNLLIVDDPIKEAEQILSEGQRNRIWNWLESSGLRRMEPEKAVVFIMHRWHIDDVVARFKRTFQDQVKIITLPALAKPDDILGRSEGEPLWPEKWSKEHYEDVRDHTATYWWLSLYQQQPGAQGNAEWPSEYFDRENLWFDNWPRTKLRVIALDPSKGRGKRSDYSAFILLGRGEDGLLYCEADLQRRPVGQIVDDGIEHYRRFQPHCAYSEADGFQELFLADFANAMLRAGVRGQWQPLTSEGVPKENRIRRIDPALRHGAIRFRNTPGTRLLVQQLREFPLGEHDDGPDALEQAGRGMDLLAGVETYDPFGSEMVPIEYR